MGVRVNHREEEAMLQLVDSGWSNVLVSGVRADRSSLRFAVPFIKISALRRLLAERPLAVRVITRFNLNDFADEVSDLDALSTLLSVGAQVRGVRHLHSKLYVFGTARAVVTSANLTVAALDRNQEFGAVMDGASQVAPCAAYFDDMWNRAGPDLTVSQVTQWRQAVAEHRKSGWFGGGGLALGDFGIDLGQNPPSSTISTPATPAAGGTFTVPDHFPAYVKFLGQSHERMALSTPILNEIERSGCNLSLAYPKGKRPRAPEGSLMFIARLTANESINDIRVFGFACAHVHEVGSDDASALDIKRRPWRSTWPHYVRIYDAHFLAGTLGDGISLNELMNDLAADSFAPTQRNRNLNRTGPIDPPRNENPRLSYSQQPSVELSQQGRDWLANRLLDAFRRLGEIPQSDLSAIA